MNKGTAGDVKELRENILSFALHLTLLTPGTS